MDMSEDVTLADTLADLKEEGSSLLVAGAVPDDKHSQVSRQLLGDPSTGPRTNLLVLTEDRLDGIDARLPHGVDLDGPGGPQIIQVTKSDRSATAAAGPNGAVTPIDRVPADSLDELATTIYETVADLEDMEPAELRVAIDSLTPLLHLHGEEKVFKVLHLLIHTLKRRQAMTHVHLPVDPDTKQVRLLRPLFDVLVELRWTNSHVQQRWHVSDGDLVTDWLEL